MQEKKEKRDRKKERKKEREREKEFPAGLTLHVDSYGNEEVCCSGSSLHLRLLGVNH